MNESISTTNPLPPSGMTNTSVPLGITSSVSETPQPINVPVSPAAAYYGGHGIYLGNFAIKDSHTIGENIYEWDYRVPLTAAYKRKTDNEGRVSSFTPWDFVLPYFSKQCKVEYELLFIPIKIGDCRARVDCVFNFEEQAFALSYDTNTLANYNQHFFFDYDDEQFRFSVPTYWITNNVTTDITKTKTDTGDINLRSAFIPATKLRMFIASQYQHNAMQMNEFNVHVVLCPRITSMIGVAGKRSVTVTRVGTGSRTDTLTPYFYMTE